jgi:hypothetical protein
MRRFKTALLSFFFLSLASVAGAQQGRLYVLCEDSPTGGGSLGYIEYYGPGTAYTELAAVGQYGSILLVDGCRVYVADGGGHVLVFDKVTGAALDTVPNVWPRQLARYADWLLVTCSAAPYFQAFDVQNGLAPVFELGTDKVRAEAEGIVVAGDTAFIAVNGFGTDSLLVAIDLLAQDTAAVIPVAPNPNSLVLHGGQVFAQCLDYFGPTGLTVSVVEAATLQEVRRDVSSLISYGLFAQNGDEILFQYSDFSFPSLSAYSCATGSFTVGYLEGSYYSAAFADAGGGGTPSLFLGQTDFATYGRVVRYAGTTAQDTVLTPVSPRSIFFEGAPAPLAFLLMDAHGNSVMPGEALYPDSLYTLYPGGTFLNTQLAFTNAQENIVSGALPNPVTFRLQGVPGSAVTVTLSSEDQAGCVYATQATFLLSLPTASPDAAPHPTPLAVPNPATHSLSLLHLPTGALVQWADALGRAVPVPLSTCADLGERTATFDVQHLPRGVYTLTVLSSAAPYTLRVVLQ